MGTVHIEKFINQMSDHQYFKIYSGVRSYQVSLLNMYITL